MYRLEVLNDYKGKYNNIVIFSKNYNSLKEIEESIDNGLYKEIHEIYNSVYLSLGTQMFIFEIIDDDNDEIIALTNCKRDIKTLLDDIKCCMDELLDDITSIKKYKYKLVFSYFINGYPVSDELDGKWKELFHENFDDIESIIEFLESESILDNDKFKSIIGHHLSIKLIDNESGKTLYAHSNFLGKDYDYKSALNYLKTVFINKITFDNNKILTESNEKEKEISNLCEDCIHKDLCKYISLFKEAEKIENKTNIVLKDTPLQFSFYCQRRNIKKGGIK